VNIGKVQEDPRWLTTFGTTRSEIIVPVLSDGACVVGLIDVESNQLNAFGADDEQFLAQCAARITPDLPAASGDKDGISFAWPETTGSP
jgi:putative methionine-R-sulfoxide reductase with GAF domain